jgi:hypothetical protein
MQPLETVQRRNETAGDSVYGKPPLADSALGGEKNFKTTSRVQKTAMKNIEQRMEQDKDVSFDAAARAVGM